MRSESHFFVRGDFLVRSLIWILKDIRIIDEIDWHMRVGDLVNRFQPLNDLVNRSGPE